MNCPLFAPFATRRAGCRPWSLLLATVSTMILLVPPVLGQLGSHEGLPVVAWEDAEQVVGRLSRVFGEVVDVGHARSVHFLNFKRHDRGAFTVVIFSESIDRFEAPLEELYLGRKVVVRGTVTRYQEAPQIVVARPSQIEVVDRFPEANVDSPAAATVGHPLVVASYNLQNLFDDEDDPYTYDEATTAKPRSQMQQVAGVIRETNADVLALQEVENRGYLQRFVDTMLAEMGYRHVVHFEGNDLRGIDVALLSRIPVGRVTSHRHLRFPDAGGGWQTFRRDLVRVELLPEGGSAFELWLVHLKSNAGDREQAEPIRRAEAQAIRGLIETRLREDPAAEFLLCGDLNDTIDSETLQTILGAEPPHMLALFESVPEEERVTYNREPHRSMIDFLLASPAMAARYVADSYVVRQGTASESGSDHNPVVASFDVRSPSALADAAADDGTRGGWGALWQRYAGASDAPRRGGETGQDGGAGWGPILIGLAVVIVMVWTRRRAARRGGG